MKDQLRQGSHLDEDGVVNCTTLAEEACGVFDLFGPEPDYEIPDFLYYVALEISQWWQLLPLLTVSDPNE